MRDPSQFARLAYRLTSDNGAIYQQVIQMHIVCINKVWTVYESWHLVYKFAKLSS